MKRFKSSYPATGLVGQFLLLYNVASLWSMFEILITDSDSLFTDAFTLAGARVVDAEVINWKTEFLNTFPVTSLERLPLQ